MGIRNPFSKRRGQQQQTSTQTPGPHQTPVPPNTGGFDFQACVAGVVNDPDLSDNDIILLMGADTQHHQSAANLPDWVKSDYISAVRKEARRRALLQEQENRQSSGDNPPGSSAPGKVDANQLNLVNYTPEQLMQQVNEDLNGVDLDAAWTVKFKESFGEIWSVIGPLALFAGTAGEVFFFIWNNTENKGAWWVALSVLVTVAVLECTFMVISYQSDTMRNRAKSKPGGATDEDKKDFRNHKIFWFILATGVATGQIAFLIAAMNAKLGNMPALIAFSIGRSAFTLAGDFYTAFVHKERPTSGERLKSRNKQRADLTNDLLQQKAVEVQIINDGVLDLRRKHTVAVMQDEETKTELEMKRMENQSRIQARKTLDDQARLFTSLGNGMMRALFDTTMNEDERQKLLGVMQGFMSAAKYLPETREGSIEISEEKGL